MIPAMGDLVKVDPKTFRERFGKAPFRVEHALSQHPLLSIESLAQLADSLPPAKAEHNVADLPAVLEPGATDLESVNQTPGEVARGIESNGCWMVLKEIEHHPEYRALLNTALDEVEEQVADLEGEMRHRVGFIFLSAPNSVTPLHIDNEHNLLLQIRGSKAITIGEFGNRALRDRELERLYKGGTTRYLGESPEESETFELQPGDGVSVPLSHPHWVQNGETVSISLSITFQTPRSERRGQVYALNSRLRRLHVSPHPPGKDGIRDRLKAATYRAARAPARARRRYRRSS
jgi:hypothetical protein